MESFSDIIVKRLKPLIVFYIFHFSDFRGFLTDFPKLPDVDEILFFFFSSIDNFASHFFWEQHRVSLQVLVATSAIVVVPSLLSKFVPRSYGPNDRLFAGF